MLAILKKELGSYFKSPLAYAFLGVFYLFSGIFFYSSMYNGISEVNYIFSSMFLFILILTPLITMKLLSDEKRTKTDQVLLTAPLSLNKIIFAKFISAYIMFFTASAINIIYGIILSFYSSINWLSLFANLLGMLLLGGAIISIGLFISSLTESQVISAVATFGVIIFLILMDSFFNNISYAPLNTFIKWISLNSRYDPFTIGIIDYSNILYFLSIMAIFVFLSIKVWDSRRYR
jgi:ABC-type Na+ efflux pump, permease component